MVNASVRKTIDADLHDLRLLLTRYPGAVDDLLDHLAHMSADELRELEHGVKWAAVTLRQVVEDTTPAARVPRTQERQPGPRIPHCRQCAPMVS